MAQRRKNKTFVNTKGAQIIQQALQSAEQGAKRNTANYVTNGGTVSRSLDIATEESFNNYLKNETENVINTSNEEESLEELAAAFIRRGKMEGFDAAKVVREGIAYSPIISTGFAPFDALYAALYKNKHKYYRDKNGLVQYEGSLLGDFFRNSKNSIGSIMNQIQADNYGGVIDMAAEDLQQIRIAEQALISKQSAKKYRQQADKLRATGDLAGYDYYMSLSKQQMNEYNKGSWAVKELSNKTTNGWEDLGTTLSEGFLNDIFEPIFGKAGNIAGGGGIESARKHLGNFGEGQDDEYNLQKLRDLRNAYLGDSKTPGYIKEWLDAQKQNLKEKESYDRLMTTDVKNSNFYQGIGTTVAGSISSPGNLVANIALSCIPGTLMYKGAKTAALIASAATTALSMGINRASSGSENSAEVHEAVKNEIKKSFGSEFGDPHAKDGQVTQTMRNNANFQKFVSEGRKALGNDNLTEQQVLDAYAEGQFESKLDKVNNIKQRAVQGSYRQYQADMDVTFTPDAIDAAITNVPIVGGLFSPLKKLKWVDKAVTATGKAFSKVPGASAIKRAGAVGSKWAGYTTAASTSPVLGSIVGASAAVTDATMHALGKTALGRAAATKIVAGADAVMGSKIAKWASGLVGKKVAAKIAEEEVANAAQSMFRKRITREAAKRLVLNAMNEAPEEAAQLYNQRLAEADTNKSALQQVSRSYGDRALASIMSGAFGAKTLFDTATLGILGITDAEARDNAFYGFLGGFLFGAPSHAIQAIGSNKHMNGALDAFRQFAISKQVANHEYQNMSTAATAAVQGKFGLVEEGARYVGQYLDTLSEDTRPFSSEDLDANMYKMRSAAIAANKPLFQKAAIAQGIDPEKNAKEYGNFTALGIMTLQNMDEVSNNVNNIKEEIDLINAENDEYTDELTKQSGGKGKRAKTFITRMSNIAYVSALLDYIEEQEKQLEVLDKDSQLYKHVQSQLDDRYKELDELLGNGLEFKYTPNAIKELAKQGVALAKDKVVHNNFLGGETIGRGISTFDQLKELYSDLFVQSDLAKDVQKSYEDLFGTFETEDGESTDKLSKEEFYSLLAEDKLVHKGGKAKSIIDRIKQTQQEDEEFGNKVIEAIANDWLKTETGPNGEQIYADHRTLDEIYADLHASPEDREDQAEQEEEQPANNPVPESVAPNPSGATNDDDDDDSKNNPPTPSTPPSPSAPGATNQDGDQGDDGPEGNPPAQPATPEPEPEPEQPVTQPEPEPEPKQTLEPEPKPDQNEPSTSEGERKNIDTTDAQKQTVDEILAVAKENRKSEVYTTGTHYIMRDKDTGELVLYQRVHELKGNAAVETVSNQAKVTRMAKLASLHKNELHKILVAVLYNNFDGATIEGVSDDTLKEYLARAEEINKTELGHELISFLNTLNRNYIEGYAAVLMQDTGNNDNFSQVIIAISNAAIQLKNPSLTVGSLYDSIHRKVFDQAYQDSPAARKNLRNTITATTNDGTVVALKDFMDKDLFDKVVDQALARKEEYNKRGWILISEPILWKGTIGKTQVAGETDMVAVDRNGDIHVIDFKTSKYSFHPEGEIDVFTQVEGKVWDTENRNRRSSYQDYSLQLSSYVILMGQQLLKAPTSVEVLGTVVNYSSDRDTGVPHRLFHTETLAPRTLDIVTSKNTPAVPWNITDIEEHHREVQNKLELIQLQISLGQLHADSIISMLSTFQVPEGLKESAMAAITDFVDICNKLNLYEDYRSVDELQGFVDLLDDIALRLEDLDRKIEAEHGEEIITQTEEQKKQRQDQQLVEQAAIADDSEAEKDFNRTDWTLKQQKDLTEEERKALDELGDVATNDDFLDTAVIEVYTKKVSRGSNLYIRVTYNGKTYPELRIFTAKGSRGTNLVRRVQQLEQEKKAGQKIVVINPRVTLGLNSHSEGSRHGASVIKELQSAIATASLGSQQDTFTIAKANSKTKQVDLLRVQDEYGNVGGTPVRSFKFSENMNENVNGHIVVILKPKGAIKGVPVVFDAPSIGEENAQLIADILRGNRGDIHGQFKDKDGNSTGLSNMSVIEMFLNSNDGFAEGSWSHSPRLIQINDPSNLMLFGIGVYDAKTDKMVLFNYDLSIPNMQPNDQINGGGMQQFIEAVSSLKMNMNAAFLNNQIGDNLSNDQKRLNAYLKKHGSISVGSIKISKDDLSKSGLSKYLGDGVLTTTFEKFTKPLIMFDEDNIGIVEEEKQSEPQNEDEDEEYGEGYDVDMYTDQTNEEWVDEGVYDIDDGLEDTFDVGMTRTQDKESKLDVQTAKQHVQEILGEDCPLKIVETIHTSLRTDGVVAGLVTADAVLLSTAAEPGTEFHEAFHRIFELAIPLNEAEAIREKIRTQLGQHLDDREIGEMLADMYMNYTKRTYHGSNDSLLTRIFHSINDLVYRIVYYLKGRTGLYNLFVEINSGKYKNTYPSEAHIKRFLSVYKNGMASTQRFKIDGKPTKHIVSQKMYNNTIEQLVFVAVTGSKIYNDGSNVYDIAKNLNRETLIKSKAYEMAALAPDKMSDDKLRELIKTTSDNMKYRYALALREACSEEFWDYTQKLLVSALGQLNLTVNEINDNNREDVALGQSESGDVSEHTRLAYEIAKFHKSSDKVKFFFATMPHKAYKIFEKDGKLHFVNVRTPEGFYKFYDASIAFNKVMNACHDARNAKELLEMIHKFANEGSEFFQVVYDRMSKINPTDDNGLGFLNDIYTAIQSNKYNFKTILVKKVKGINAYTYDLVDVGFDSERMNKSRTWIERVATGHSKYYTVKDKKVVFNGDNVKTIIEKLCNIISNENGTLYPAGTVIDGVKTTTDVYSNGLMEVLQWRHDQKLKGDENTGDAKRQLIIKQNGQLHEINLDNPQDMIRVKAILVSYVFPAVGVDVTIDEFNDMLMSLYGSVGADALYDMFHQTVTVTNSNRGNDGSKEDGNKKQTSGTASVAIVQDGLLNKMRAIINNPEVELSADSLKRNSFVIYMANGITKGFSDNYAISGHGVGNKTFYAMAEDNAVSTIFKMINRVAVDENGERVYNDDEVECLFEDPYNLYTDEDGVVHGAFILKNAGKVTVTLDTYTGISDVHNRDQFATYTEQQQRDQILSQFIQVQFGRLPLPTPADKSTYMSLLIQGVALPGLNYENLSASNMNSEYHVDVKKSADGKVTGITVEATGRILEQMLDYAFSEYNSVTQAINREVSDDQRVANEENLKHFNTFLGTFDDNGVLHPFANKDAQKELQNAKDAFFGENVSDDQRALLMNRAIDYLVDSQLKQLVDNKIVEQVDGKYRNKSLDHNVLQQIKLNLMHTGLAESDLVDTAIRVYVRDVVLKCIMGKAESERCITGNPGFYTITRDSNTSEITDSYSDQGKRLGSFMSTGSVGNQERSTYKCAEVVNDRVASEQVDEVRKLVEYSVYRNAYPFGSEELEVDEIKKRLPAKTISECEREIAKTVAMFSGGINVADGATYITPELTRDLLKAQGGKSWNKKVKEAFDILTDPNKVSDIYTKAAAYKTIFTEVIGTQKYTAVGFRKRTNADGSVQSIPYVHKTALFPLFDCIAFGKSADVLHKMREDGVEMLLTTSSTKVGSQGAIGSEEEVPDFASPDTHLNSYTCPFAFLRKQLNTDPNEKSMLKVGIQTIKVALSSLDLTQNYEIRDPYHGNSEQGGETTTVTGQQLLDTLMEDINALATKGFNDLLEQWFDEKTGTLDAVKFSKQLANILSSHGVSPDVIQSMTKVENGELVNLPDAMSQGGILNNLMNSALAERIVRVQSPGAPFIQRSVWFMEGRGTFGDLVINNGNPLKMINEEGSMDCVLSIDYFIGYTKYKGVNVPYFKLSPNKNVKLYHEKDGKVVAYSFEECRQWLIDNGIIGGPQLDEKGNVVKHGAKANILSYRIPTQAQASINALRCVDVIPTVRDTVILPREFTALTGSDFDIDKLFLSTMTYGFDGLTVSLKNVKKNSINELQNKIINAYIEITRTSVLQHANNAIRPIDNDTELINGDVLSFVRRIYKNDKKYKLDQVPFGNCTIEKQCNIHDTFMAGKSGIGPFALALVNQVLTTLYDVRFASKSFPLHRSRLSAQRDMENNSIMSWLSGFISAHVDMAKDPYVAELNVNEQTYSLICLLTRLGYGKKGLLFLNTPLMRELSKNMAQVKSVILGNLEEDPRYLYNEAKKSTILKFIPKEKYKTFVELAKNKGFIKQCFLIFEEIDMEKAIENVSQGLLADSDITIELEDSTYELTPEMFAMVCYIVQDNLQPWSTTLSDLIKFSVVDNERAATNAQTWNLYLKQAEALFNGKDTIFVNGRKYFTKSYIKTKIDYMTDMTNRITSALSIVSSNDVEALLVMCKGSTDRYTDKLLTKYRESIAAYKKGLAINDYCKREGIDIRELLFGSVKKASLRDRVMNLKLNASNPSSKYHRLHGNMLLEALNEGPDINTVLSVGKYAKLDEYHGAKLLFYSKAFNDDPSFNKQLENDWDALLHDEDPAVVQLAKDLVVYAFVTSGDRPGYSKFFGRVPASWREESGYSKYLKDNAHVPPSLTDIVLNNWHDSDFVPTVKTLSTATKIRFIQPAGYIRDYGASPIIGGLQAEKINGETQVSAIYNVEDCPSYIKVQSTNFNSSGSQRNYTVYKLQGWASIKIGNDVIDYPVFVAINQKGIKYGNYNIYSYGTQTGNPNNTQFTININGDDGQQRKVRLTDMFDSFAKTADQAQQAALDWWKPFTSYELFNEQHSIVSDIVAKMSPSVSNDSKELTDDVDKVCKFR